MDAMRNPHKGRGLRDQSAMEPGEIVSDPSAARALFARCPEAAETPLHDCPDLARATGVASVSVKDERARMGLGSFKALGAAFAIAKQAAAVLDEGSASSAATALSGRSFVCASAGNHGLSMAAGARIFGARGIVYLADTVPEAFAERLRAQGAEVVRAGAIYEESMAAARDAAEANGWTLLSDSSWLGYSAPARDVMEGYLIMGDEAARQIPAPPSHIFLQAGVGGMAAACAAAARHAWGADPVLIVVEPEFAPALLGSIRAGRAVAASGPVSAMGRLDCKEPSHLALRYLAREADVFMTVTEEEAAKAVESAKNAGMATTPSGAAGVAGLMAADREALGLGGDARVLVYLSEGPE
jgi:diaminopropionate ammonia-lyase